VRVNVQSTAAGAITGVLNMGGNDTIDVCSDTVSNQGDLSGLKGTLLVEALGGTDLLVVSEAGRQTGDDVVVTANALGSRDGPGFTIDYRAAGGTFSGINFASGAGNDHFTVLGTPAGVPMALYTMGGNDAVVVGVTPDSGYELTVVGGPTGNAVPGVADLSGTAVIDNVATGLDSGLVRALYAGGKRSTITYRDVDQVFTSPPAGCARRGAESAEPVQRRRRARPAPARRRPGAPPPRALAGRCHPAQGRARGQPLAPVRRLGSASQAAGGPDLGPDQEGPAATRGYPAPANLVASSQRGQRSRYSPAPGTSPEE
jgi:hypothetical protein